MIRGLDRDRWVALSPYLDQGLEMTGEARAAWLEGLRARDPGLAREIEELLAEYDCIEGGHFLESSPTLRATLAGHTLGAYTLRRQIGQGGMGSVWLADRSDGRYEGVAAVKLLNLSLMGHDAEARFRREGSILARLRHRHIAQLIDAGVSSAGQPFLVLEHVDGQHVDAYCDRHRLGIDARVSLFLDVLAAVSHAHANLIVHRDLKPSNVLVSGDGTVKLLDFGVAKLLAAEGGGAPTLTLDVPALTPEYAAPEQLTGGDMTTAVDVYALGVLLYELLSGRHPAGPLPRSSPGDLIRTVLEREPARLSAGATAVDGEPDTSRARAMNRGGTTEALQRALRGDLETIVAKALKKDPGERYAAAEAMADDLRRYLAHAPISARPDRFTYRAAKFVRRHRLTVALSGVLLAALAAGLAGTAWQAREAQKQRDDARAQLARATAVNDFMEVLISVAAPEGRAFEVGDLLDQGALSVERQFAADDPMRAELLVTVGQHFMVAQAWDKATPLLERAIETAQKSGEPALKARALCTLASLRVQRGDRPAGDALMAEAFGQLPADPRYALTRATCLAMRSAFDDFPSDADRMVRDATEALALLDQVPFPAQMIRFDALGSLAYGHYLAGRTRQADEAYERLWALFEQKGLERTTPASITLNNWSVVHFRGDIARAEVLCRRALELRRLIEGPQGIAPGVTFNHAGALLRLGRYDEARRLFEEAIATAAARQSHRTRFDAMMELADLSIEEGDLARAATQLAHVARQAGHPSFDVGRRMRLLHYEGRLALARGEPAQARARFAEAAPLFEQHQPKTVLYVRTMIGLAQSEQGLGRGAEALTAARRALTLAESYVEKDAPSYLVGLAHLAEADIQTANGQNAAARASYRMAHDHLQRTLGPLHASTVAARNGGASTE